MGKMFRFRAACFQHTGLELICQFSGIFILKIMGNNTDTQKRGRRFKASHPDPLSEFNKEGEQKCTFFVF